MLDIPLDYGQRIINITRRLDQHDEAMSRIGSEIKDLRQEVKEMGEAIRYINDQHQHKHDKNAYEAANMRRDLNELLLRLELALARAGVGALPPAPSGLPDASTSSSE